MRLPINFRALGLAILLLTVTAGVQECEGGAARAAAASLRAKRSNPIQSISPRMREPMDCFVALLPCANASRLSQAMTELEAR